MENLLENILGLISLLVINFSQAYTIWLISKFICKEKFSYKKLFITFVCFLPVTIIATWLYNSMPNLSLLKSLITILSALLVTLFLYKAKLFKAIAITLISIFIPFVLDIVAVLIISTFTTDNSVDFVMDNKIVYYISNIILNIFSILLLKLIDILVSNKLSFAPKSLKNIDYNPIIYNGLVIIITLTPSMFLMYSTKYNYHVIFLVLNIIQLIVVCSFSFIYMKKHIYFKDTELELENTKLHNKALSTINESIRGFKHDMGNIVQSINGYLAVGNIDGVKTYCQNLLQGFNDVNLLSILSPKVINDPAIYGIVVSKMLYARENNLTLSLDVSIDVSQINFPNFELSRIIGILLDNAIEAALESDEKKLKLDMYYDDKRKSDIIIIGNSVKDAESVDIIKMFEKDYSTKENPSGFGLYEVLKFLKKNNKGDIVPNVDYDKNFFTQTLTFDK